MPSLSAAPLDLSKFTKPASLDAVIASTSDAGLKKALHDHAAAILAAAAQQPHVAAVIRAVETSPGKVEKINTTPEALKKPGGGAIALFDTLRLVDLAMPNAGPHDHRKADPYDAAFFAHLGHIAALESLNIIATKLSDDWIAPLGKLTNLRTLRFTNYGKLSDAGNRLNSSTSTVRAHLHTSYVVGMGGKNAHGQAASLSRKRIPCED